MNGALTLLRATAIGASSWLVFAAAHAAGAGEARFTGSATAELRSFPESPAFGAQLEGQQASVVLEPRLEWESDDGRDQARMLAFWRHDGSDEERSHFDLREAYWRRSGERWELLAGVERVFWGVAESRHLVDVVNQVDGLERIDGEEKLGQPMVQASTQGSWGRLSGFALLGFRERRFPGESGRLRPPLPVAKDAVYESAAGDRRVDLAVRWTHSPGPWDLGVHVFHGTGREPRLVPVGDEPELTPYYEVITQAGLDAQLTRGAWLFKLELLGRSGQGRDFGASVVGFERTLYQVFGTPADVGLLVEYLWDGRGELAPPTPFEDDAFLGTRIALNDFQDTQVLAGMMLDLHDGSRVLTVEAERRLGGGFAIELEGRWFLSTERSPVLAALGQDDYYTVSFARYF